MTKFSLRLPLKLRFILGYLYFTVFSTSLVTIFGIFGPSESVFAGFENTPSGTDELVGRSIMAVTSLATIGLAIWTIKLIYRRSSYAGIGYVLLNLVSYGLYTIAPTPEGFVAVPAVVTVLVILTLDILITLYLLTSKEAHQVLNKK